jgi:hypothetical protein
MTMRILNSTTLTATTHNSSPHSSLLLCSIEAHIERQIAKLGMDNNKMLDRCLRSIGSRKKK